MVVLLHKHSGRVAIVGATLFPVGIEVEVQRSNDGIKGTWYEATIFEVHPQGRCFDVIYTATDDEPLHPHDDDDFALQPMDTQDQERMINLFGSKLDQQSLLGDDYVTVWVAMYVVVIWNCMIFTNSRVVVKAFRRW